MQLFNGSFAACLRVGEVQRGFRLGGSEGGIRKLGTETLKSVYMTKTIVGEERKQKWSTSVASRDNEGASAKAERSACVSWQANAGIFSGLTLFFLCVCLHALWTTPTSVQHWATATREWWAATAAAFWSGAVTWQEKRYLLNCRCSTCTRCTPTRLPRLFSSCSCYCSSWSTSNVRKMEGYSTTTNEKIKKIERTRQACVEKR